MSLLDEDLGIEQEVVYMYGVDKDGHPVCYNAYDEYQNKELYQATFSDEEKRTHFLQWRIQFLEKSIRKLDFSLDGIFTIVQIINLKFSPSPSRKNSVKFFSCSRTITQNSSPNTGRTFKDGAFRVPNGGESSSAMKAPVVKNLLPCSLEDLYKGAKKKMKISRAVPNSAGYVALDCIVDCIVVDPCATFLVFIVTGLLCVGIKERVDIKGSKVDGLGKDLLLGLFHIFIIFMVSINFSS
ncbi:hypothetical protein Lser_V15G31992 [Lactuca serriola]